MALANGSRLGAYEILSALGAGGMGEVYRARDTKLNRDVAIKVLLPAVANDPDRLARFSREAQVLASLNHPNIAHNYGIEDADGVKALVLELVDGEDLAQRIARGAIPLNEALPIAEQIAEALEAAHEQGIIHRDLKPANIRVRPDGTVKVLDFGLAKAMDPAGTSSANAMNSPTLSMHATQAGIILGTAAYMSPEQARGKAVDKRADIWAFGVVLFEMLTGKRAFAGDDVSDTLVSVFRDDPDWSALPAGTPSGVVQALRVCLQKDPKQRVRDITAVRLAMEGAFDTGSVRPDGGDGSGQQSGFQKAFAPRGLRPELAVAFALLAAIVAGTVIWFATRPLATSAAVTRFPVLLGEGQQFSNTGRQVVAFSADGTQLVYVAKQRLYLRTMRDVEAREMTGTADLGGVLHPVFSPDGQSIAFFAVTDQTIKRIAVAGGVAVTICRAESPFGMSWSGDTIVFGQRGKGIVRVSAAGGIPEPLVTVNGDEIAHGPQMLPGGDAVLFTLAGGTNVTVAWDKAKIVVQSLRTGKRTVLVEGGSDGRYVPPNHLLYAIGGVVFGIPFDLKQLTVTGSGVPVIEGVRRSGGTSRFGGGTATAQFSVSDTGSLAYVPGPTGMAMALVGQQEIGIFDRTGVAHALKLPAGPYGSPRLSPDARQIVFDSDDGRDANIWVYDLSGTSSMRRLTFGGRNRMPIWSADSRHVAFQSDRDGDLAIFWQLADGTGTAERLTRPDAGTDHLPLSWSPHADRFIFDVVTKGGTTSLWIFSLADRKASAFGVADSLTPTGAVFSPDERWVAYSSRDTRQTGNVVYVQPFPATGAKYQISKDSEDGHHPVWISNGRELFFTTGPGQSSIVSVTTTPSVTVGVAEPSGQGRMATLAPTSTRPFDAGPDGKNLLGLLVVNATDQSGSATTTPQIQVVLNWFEELNRLVPTKR